MHFEKGLAERIFDVAETKRALIASAREITGAVKYVITDDAMRRKPAAG